MEPEPDIRPGRDNESDRVASMRLRAERPRVTRLSRKVLAGGAAIGLVAICRCGALGVAEQSVAYGRHRGNSTPPIITMSPMA